MKVCAGAWEMKVLSSIVLALHRCPLWAALTTERWG